MKYTFVFTDVPPWCLRVLLEFMYTGQLIVKSGVELELLKVARHLRIEKVVELLHSTFDLTTPAATPVKLIAKNVCNIQIKAEPEAENSPHRAISKTICEGEELAHTKKTGEKGLLSSTRVLDTTICISPSPCKAPPLKASPVVEEMEVAKKQLDFSKPPVISKDTNRTGSPECFETETTAKNTKRTESTQYHETQTTLPPISQVTAKNTNRVGPTQMAVSSVKSVTNPIAQKDPPAAKTPIPVVPGQKFSLLPSVDENGVHTGFLLKAVTGNQNVKKNPKTDGHENKSDVASSVSINKASTTKHGIASPLRASTEQNSNRTKSAHDLEAPKGIPVLGVTAKKSDNLKQSDLETSAKSVQSLPVATQKKSNNTKSKDGSILKVAESVKKSLVSKSSDKVERSEETSSSTPRPRCDKQKTKESGSPLQTSIVAEKKDKNTEKSLRSRMEKSDETNKKDVHQSVPVKSDSATRVGSLKLVDGCKIRSLTPGRKSKQASADSPKVQAPKPAVSMPSEQKSVKNQTKQAGKITSELLELPKYQPTVMLERIKLPYSVKKENSITDCELTAHSHKEPLALPRTRMTNSQLVSKTVSNQDKTADEITHNIPKAEVVSKSKMAKQKRGYRNSPRMTVTLEKTLSPGLKKRKTKFNLSVSVPEQTLDSSFKKLSSNATKKQDKEKITNLHAETIVSLKEKRIKSFDGSQISSLPFKKRSLDRINSDEYAKNLELVRVTPKKQKLDDAVPSKQDTHFEEKEASDHDGNVEDDFEELPTLKLKMTRSSRKKCVKMRGSKSKNTKLKKAKNGRLLMRLTKSACYQCEKCGEQYENAYLMTQHTFWQHISDKSLIYLAKAISRKGIVQAMMTRAHRTIAPRKKGSRKTFYCKICKFSFSFYSTWSLHWIRQHAPKTRKSLSTPIMKHLQWKNCVLTDKFPLTRTVTAPEPAVTTPVEEDPIIVLYKCSICSNAFMSEEELAKHVMSIHNMTIETTQVCDKKQIISETTDTTKLQAAHTTVSTDTSKLQGLGNKGMPISKEGAVDAGTTTRNAYHCRMCKLDLFSQLELTKHQEEVHGIFTGRKKVNKLHIRCEVQGCDFSSPNITIMNTHFQEKHPYVLHYCGTCSATFRMLFQLDKHTYNRHGPGCANYCQKCDIAFNRYTQLEKHKEELHGYRRSQVSYLLYIIYHLLRIMFSLHQCIRKTLFLVPLTGSFFLLPTEIIL